MVLCEENDFFSIKFSFQVEKGGKEGISFRLWIGFSYIFIEVSACLCSVSISNHANNTCTGHWTHHNHYHFIWSQSVSLIQSISRLYHKNWPDLEIFTNDFFLLIY